jgi:hypothetical protein
MSVASEVKGICSTRTDYQTGEPEGHGHEAIPMASSQVSQLVSNGHVFRPLAAFITLSFHKWLTDLCKGAKAKRS